MRLAWKYGIIPNIICFHVASFRKVGPQMENSSREPSLSLGLVFLGPELKAEKYYVTAVLGGLRELGKRKGRSPPRSIRVNWHVICES